MEDSSQGQMPSFQACCYFCEITSLQSIGVLEVINKQMSQRRELRLQDSHIKIRCLFQIITVGNAHHVINIQRLMLILC